MIKLKKRFECDYRLYDTVTGQFLPFTAENRCKALFCMLVECESKKTNKSKDYRYSVEEMADIYFKELTDTIPHQLNTLLAETFLYKLDRKIGTYSLINDKNFYKLALCVLSDQKNENTRINKNKISQLKKDYAYMNDKIFDNKKSKTEVL